MRISITHSTPLYKSGQKYTVYEELDGDSFTVVSSKAKIKTVHAKQIPNSLKP